VGEVFTRARITSSVREEELVMYEVWFKDRDYCVQNIVDDTQADMGGYMTGAPGAAIHDQFADIEKVEAG